MANRQNSAHDWLAIEKRYVEGRESQRILAAAINISKSTLMKQAADRGWGKKRKAYRKKLRDGEQTPVEDPTDDSREPVGAELAAGRSRLLSSLADLRDSIIDELC